MNILVLSWRDIKHPLAGGAEQVMNEHMGGWINAGHSVTHFSSFVKGLPREEIIDGVKIFRSGHQHLGVQISAFLWYTFGNHEKFDLVIDEFHGIPFFAPFYVRVKKLAVLQEVAREVWLKNDLHFPFNLIIGLMGYLLEPLVFIFYKKIPFMVGSKSAKDSLIKLSIPDKNISIIQHGVIIQSPKGEISKNKTKTITFLGALAKDKGIEDSIKCFAILSKKNNFNFWIIGKGGNDYLIWLKNLVNNFKLSNRVKFWGHVTQTKKFELLEKTHILINPSLLEGWGLVNIEANAMGTPVIAYNSPGLIDSVRDGETGIICQKNTPEEMANEVTSLLSDEVKYKKLQNESIKWSKNFSWDKSRSKSLMLVDSIYKGKYSFIS